MGLNEARLVPCPDCRALVPDVYGPTHAYLGGSAGCWAAWGELQARGYADPAAGALLPLAVDAYAAQHPRVEGRRQAQSVWEVWAEYHRAIRERTAAEVAGR